jgi:pimeloyl-ACP methyl ester carboxylesterase
MKTLVLALVAGAALAVTCSANAAVKTIVLVHGAFSDASGWRPVTDILERDGYSVRAVQEPLTSFEDDVAATRRVLDKSDPCVLVGHSYAGMIITELGAHPAVKSLVYVMAFQPEVGESAGALNGRIPPASNSIGPIGDGFVQINPDAFAADFAADVPKSQAHFMAISQVPTSAAVFGAKATVASWKTKPSYAVIAKDDRMVNPDVQRFMAQRAKSQTIELPGSHAAFISHATEIAALIERAAKAAN